MSFKGTLLIVLIPIIGTWFQEIGTLSVEGRQNQRLKNSILSFGAEETSSTPTNGSLSLLANETVTSSTEGQLSPSISEAPSPADNEVLSMNVNETLPSFTNKSSAEDQQLASRSEKLSAADNEVLSSSANETLSPSANETLSPSANETLSLSANETLSSSSSSSSSSNGTLSQSLNETLSSAKKALSKAGNLTLSIIYGSLNEQIGNEYLTSGQGEGQASDNDEPLAPGTQIVYGSTTTQKNNTYMAVGHAENIYVTIPAIDEPLPISVPGLSVLQNITTSSLIFDVNDPMGKRIKNFISTFNGFQQSFDRIVRLASPFLIDNEINLLLRKIAKDDSTRQSKEIEWLSTVASHRMKFIKLYKVLISMCNKLKLKSEVTANDLNAAKRKQHHLIHSEKILRNVTQDFVLYVLSK